MYGRSMLRPCVLQGRKVNSCRRAGPSSNGRTPGFGSTPVVGVVVLALRCGLLHRAAAARSLGDRGLFTVPALALQGGGDEAHFLAPRHRRDPRVLAAQWDDEYHQGRPDSGLSHRRPVPLRPGGPSRRVHRARRRWDQRRHHGQRPRCHCDATPSLQPARARKRGGCEVRRGHSALGPIRTVCHHDGRRLVEHHVEGRHGPHQPDHTGYQLGWIPKSIQFWPAYRSSNPDCRLRSDGRYRF